MSDQNNDPKWKVEKERILSLSLEERRKTEYFCKDFVKLEEIEAWAKQGKDTAAASGEKDKIKAKLFENFEINEDIHLAEKVSLYEGDITRLEIDAIVNAANNSLLGGGGVDGAIHRAAGPHLREENRDHGGCGDGEAVISGGYRLPAQHIISTVGPQGEHPDTLRSAYTNCLNKMKEAGLKSIAFPCISTGIYGYPNDAACNVALRSVREFLENNDEAVERVIFCLFLPVDVKLYKERINLMFPVKTE